MTGAPSFAIIIPFFDEAQNVELVCIELKEVLRKELSEGEVILVDDGSEDGTGDLLDRVASNWPECRVFHLDRNRGQAAALLFGFSKTTAAVIVTMDGDGQNDPRDIAKLLAGLEEADMVVGARVRRRDSWPRRKISRIANYIRADFLRDGVSDSGCGLKVFRREVVDAFIPIRTLYSFMPAMAVAAGFQVVEKPVNHRPRQHGSSKYTITSFLFLPVVDFLGLRWFSSRRCNGGSAHSLHQGTIQRRSRDDFYKHPFKRWAATVTVAIAIGIIAWLEVVPSKHFVGPEARKVSLKRAEEIALHRTPGGRLGVEELRWKDNRLVWTIDVHLSHSPNLNEIEIDALDGHVIAARAESAAEEELEQAAEDHHFNLKPQKSK